MEISRLCKVSHISGDEVKPSRPSSPTPQPEMSNTRNLTQWDARLMRPSFPTLTPELRHESVSRVRPAASPNTPNDSLHNWSDFNLRSDVHSRRTKLIGAVSAGFNSSHSQTSKTSRLQSSPEICWETSLGSCNSAHPRKLSERIEVQISKTRPKACASRFSQPVSRPTSRRLDSPSSAQFLSCEDVARAASASRTLKYENTTSSPTLSGRSNGLYCTNPMIIALAKLTLCAIADLCEMMPRSLADRASRPSFDFLRCIPWEDDLALARPCFPPITLIFPRLVVKIRPRD
mmetsp:Transcript_6736/g.10656  ORF Transcript_6736/g.10656 Transcript_6736/m.10656 type:complete len:290 (-) Transcript_6736:53-922(-)